MQSQDLKLQVLGRPVRGEYIHFKLWVLAVGFHVLAVFGLGGCSGVSPLAGARWQSLSYQEELSAPYDQTELRKSLTLDVLPKIQRLEDGLGSGLMGTELLSHSESVVASLGQSKDGYETWFNMVTFHEYRQNVIRKYFFFVADDKPGTLQIGPSRALRFDCEMLLEKEALEELSTAEKARQIAILRHALNNLHEDIDELGADVDAPGQDNRMLDICRMLVNQAFEMILLKLEASPVLARKLSQAGGVEFDHMSFDKGKVKMVVENDVVTVKIRLGALVHTIENDQ